MKELIEHADLGKLKNVISTKVPENIHFELPGTDENIGFKFLPTLDISKATGLDGVGPRLLKLSSGIVTKS